MATTLLPWIFGLAALSLLLTLLTHLAAHRLLARRPRRGAPTPPLSILKPVKGIDEGLWENLVALARQDYPHFEILIGAQDAADPALRLAARFRREFPRVPVRVLVCDRPVGANPKVNNLVTLAAAAEHDLLLVSDSNVRPRPGYLRALAAELADPRVGLVSSLLAGTGERTTGALLENAYLNSFIAGVVAAGDAVGHPCVIGKSMLLRRSQLERLGGWASVADLLAEDYLLGAAYRRAGYRVALSNHVLPTVNRCWSVRRFLARHLRWMQMRRWINRPAYAAEPLLNPVLWCTAALAAAALAGPAATPAAPLVAAAGIAAKCLADLLLARRLRRAPVRPLDLAWIPVKDLLVAALWAAAWFHRTVAWRDNTFRIGPGSRLTPTPRRPRAPAPLPRPARG